MRQAFRRSHKGGRLHVAMVAPPFVRVPPHHYGGTELVVAELVDGLLDRGAQVTLFATGDSTGGFQRRCKVSATFPHGVWPPSAPAELEHCAFVARQLHARRGDFDVVHTHCASFLHFASKLDLPVVHTLHHKYDAETSRLYQSHSTVTYVSISARQLELNGSFARCAVVHHGIDPTRYRLADPRPDTVAFLGRLSEVKAPHVAVDVARQAGLRLRVGGRAHEEDLTYFEREVSWRLRQDHVEYLGEVSHEPKVALLSTARALLFPIGWEEPFGLVAIEAMFSGCPVVAFPRGSVPEIVDEGITGFIAKDADHMAELLQGPAAPDRFDRERCRARAIRRFSAARMVDDYLRVYALALRTLRNPAARPPGLIGTGLA